MYYSDIKAYVAKEDKETLIRICKEIYEWKYITSVLPEDSKLKELGKKMDYPNLANISEVVLQYMNEELAPVVALLISEFPNYYFRPFKNTLRKSEK